MWLIDSDLKMDEHWLTWMRTDWFQGKIARIFSSSLTAKTPMVSGEDFPSNWVNGWKWQKALVCGRRVEDWLATERVGLGQPDCRKDDLNSSGECKLHRTLLPAIYGSEMDIIWYIIWTRIFEPHRCLLHGKVLWTEEILHPLGNGLSHYNPIICSVLPLPVVTNWRRISPSTVCWVIFP